MRRISLSSMPTRVACAYGDKLDRLVRIKRQWDPHNLLRGNHNIDPAA